MDSMTYTEAIGRIKSLRACMAPSLVSERDRQALDKAAEELTLIRDTIEQQRVVHHAQPETGYATMAPMDMLGSNPPPTPSREPSCHTLVVQDMLNRQSFGLRKYGTPLQPGNGRDFLIDAYEEALDMVVYLRGALYERDAR